MPKQLRFLSVCSGIEAASVAWEQLGWKAAGFAEIEPFPAAVLKHRYPTVPNFGDLNGHEQWPLAAGDVDIIVGGPPCQAFSVAGLREGMADPRGNLSLVYFQLVSRLRPKWIVYENVPGLLSARGGQDFSSLLSALAECGYGFAYRMLDAANFGLAQRRKRIFIVGCRTGDWRHPTAVLFDGPSSFGNPKAGKKAGEGSASPAGASVGSPSRINCRPDGISGTVTNKWHKGSGGPAGDEHYNLVVGSSEALPVIADRASFNQGENALYDPFIGHTDTCPTLVAKGPHAVQPPIAFKVRGGGEYTGTKGGEVKPNERGGTGMLHYEDKTFTVAATQDQFVATPVQPIPINTMAALRDQSAEQNRQTFGVGQPGDTMYTITKAHHHAVGVQQQLLYENHAQDSRVTGPHDLSPTVAAKFGTGGGNVPLVQAADPVTFQPGNLRRDAGADPSTETTTTLKASMGDQMPHIAYRFDNDTLQHKGISHASTQEANAREILRVLQDKVGKEAFTQWGLGILDTLQSEKVLRSFMYGFGVRLTTSKARPELVDCPLPCEEGLSSWGLQQLWEEGPDGRTSQGRELAKQLSIQFGKSLPFMSYQVTSAMSVRRLLPLETERLQGFPDNWTKIPWRGKPADLCPDGPRYKAIGNSMATNCMAWIGKRIQMVDEVIG